MDLTKVEYSSKLMTLEQHIWLQDASKGDYHAMKEIICARTNIPEEEALQLHDNDIQAIFGEIAIGIAASFTLQELMEGLPNA